MGWFRALARPPMEVPSTRGHVLHFRDLGPLVVEAGLVDARRSPVATVYPPRIRRGVLWTVGEVHFLATPLRQLFPELDRIAAMFRRWLGTHDCVHEGAHPKTSPWAYWLEGSIKNFAPPIYAFPSGLEALRDGRYFVADDDTEARVDELCATLRLRGVAVTATDRDPA